MEGHLHLWRTGASSVEGFLVARASIRGGGGGGTFVPLGNFAPPLGFQPFKIECCSLYARTPPPPPPPLGIFLDEPLVAIAFNRQVAPKES